MGKYKLTWRDIKLEDFKTYLFAMFKAFIPKKKIKNLDELEQFIQTKSAWVTQVTLYNYLKTRMGTRYVLHFDNDEFMSSVNLAKWNIYVVALADCAFYVFSYLISEKNLKENECKEVFLNILENEKKNGLNDEIFDRGKKNFLERINKVNFLNYHLDDPFKESGQALYYWSPIADELKSLDKKIVLNSIHLKWGLMKDEFKKLTKDLKFN